MKLNEYLLKTFRYLKQTHLIHTNRSLFQVLFYSLTYQTTARGIFYPNTIDFSPQCIHTLKSRMCQISGSRFLLIFIHFSHSRSLGKVHSGAILNKSWKVTVVLPKDFCVELRTKISMNWIPHFYRCNDSAVEFCSSKIRATLPDDKNRNHAKGTEQPLLLKRYVHIIPCVEWILQKCRKYPWYLHASNV